jgi:predicted acylesterase/phospholipase RssA
MQSLVARISVLLLASGLCACSQTQAFNSVPRATIDRAEIVGFNGIRAWGDGPAADLKGLPPERAQSDAPVNYLALSGGSSDGAYAAGLLAGWTAAGTRPSFAVVTGVSTGALASPFAFLGSSHDAGLREIYTQYSTSDLGTPQIFSALLGGPSIIDSTGLEKLLAHYVDARLLAAIAREHNRGRRLLVATTNVEAERQVIWNLGAIAASGQPEAASLFRRVLLASAAVPGVFPPVLIQVKVNGRDYQEMHADGGTMGQVFFVPQPSSLQPARIPEPQRTIYVIRNGKLGPDWQATQATTLSIASRSLNSLIKAQARGDVERLQAMASRNGINFRLAAIPESFSKQPTEAFDRAYMRHLFDIGFRQAVDGYPWGSSSSATAFSR